ncbi:MAG: hypothetical protein QXU82_02785 [Candidatus Aenigmatarchaeota archaeon]
MHKINRKPERFRQAWKAYADPFSIDRAMRETGSYSNAMDYGTYSKISA